MSDEKQDNIHNLPNSSRETTAVLERLSDDVIDECKVIAEMRYGNYLAHIKAGFSKEESVILCIKFGFNP